MLLPRHCVIREFFLAIFRNNSQFIEKLEVKPGSANLAILSLIDSLHNRRVCKINEDLIIAQSEDTRGSASFHRLLACGFDYFSLNPNLASTVPMIQRKLNSASRLSIELFGFCTAEDALGKPTGARSCKTRRQSFSLRSILTGTSTYWRIY